MNTTIAERSKRTAEAVGYRTIGGNHDVLTIKKSIKKGGFFGELKGKQYLISISKNNTCTVYTGTNDGKGGLELEKWISGIETFADARDWARGTILNETK